MNGDDNHARDRLLLFGGWLLSTVGGLIVVGLLYARRGVWLTPWWLMPLLLALAWHRWMFQPGGVPVLMYHSVSADSSWLPWAAEISVSSETFARHLRLIDEWGYRVVPTRELVVARQSGASLPNDALVIHLDDGYLDNWVAAAPLLQRHGFPATLCVTLDFIAPEGPPRPTIEDVDAGRVPAAGLEWDGYLSWTELGLLARSDRFEIQAHGRDHGRVEIGPRIEATLEADNWRRLAWVQWAQMPGPKWDWYRQSAPPAVPLGNPVRESAPALSARQWSGGELESAERFDARVEAELRECREELERRLETTVDLFCWPQLTFCERGRELARRVGYRATATGDQSDNRPGDDPTLIGRIHVGERALGWRCRWADDLALYARLRIVQGNRYWLLALAPIRLVGRAVEALRTGIIGR